MRKITITESQLNKLLGEEFSGIYNNSSDDIPDGGFMSKVEVTPNEFTDDEKDKKYQSQTPEKANRQSPRGWSYAGYSRGRGICESKKKTLHEDNKKLTSMGHSLRAFGPKAQGEIDKLHNKTNDRLITSLSSEDGDKGRTANSYYVIRNRLNGMIDPNSDNYNPERYAEIGGDMLLKHINKKLDTASSMTNGQKKNVQNPPKQKKKEYIKKNDVKSKKSTKTNKTSDGSNLHFM